MLKKTEIELPTGTLELVTEEGIDLDLFCDFAARANPKRGFLIVSKVLGRHLPATPHAMRQTMHDLGQKLPSDLPGPVVFLGMAETATALGQGVFVTYQQMNPDQDVVYLQSSRQRVDGAKLVASFEEGHSHATTHLVQITDSSIDDTMRSARTLVIVDDECSTGNTFVAAARAMSEIMESLELVATCCIIDWSGGDYCRDIPHRVFPVSVIAGSMEWKAGPTPNAEVLATGSNLPGYAAKSGMKSRGGLRAEESARRSEIDVKPAERILVLGEGEHSYEALRIAEEIERKGGIAAVQCITRSPALIGFAMKTRSTFTDSYGSGAPCFLYNILGHQPDRIVIVVEQLDKQAEDARAAVAALTATPVPIDIILCRYDAEE